LGTNLFPASEKPYYRKGAWVSCAMCLVVATTSLCLTGYLIRENKRLAREGLLIEEGEIIDAPGLTIGDVAGTARERKVFKYVY